MDDKLMAQAEELVGNLFAKVGLWLLTCPTSGICFGMNPDDIRFAEQTDESVWCPRGHNHKVIFTGSDRS